MSTTVHATPADDKPPSAATRPPLPPEIYPAKAASRPGAALPPPPLPLPVGNVPPEVYPSPAAKRPGGTDPIPPLIDFEPRRARRRPEHTPPSTLPLGTVPQRPLPLAAGDAYSALGSRRLVPVFSGGRIVGRLCQQSEPYRTAPGSPYFVVAPELLVQSDWSQHSLTANIVGSYTD